MKLIIPNLMCSYTVSYLYVSNQVVLSTLPFDQTVDSNVIIKLRYILREFNRSFVIGLKVLKAVNGYAFLAIFSFG